MNLSAPKVITWIVAVVLGVAGLLIHYGFFSLGVDGILLVGAAFVLLVVATAIEGL